jgi:protein SCO1
MKIVVLLVAILVVVACQNEGVKRVLPFYGNFDIEYRMENGKEVADTIYPKMIKFSYLNQDSMRIDSEDMKGKIWVADFFFTSCPSICPKMTEQMKRLNHLTEDLGAQIQFLSFSIDPTRDTPSRLLEYRRHHEINAKNWHFFTGDEEKTHALGINNFQIFAKEDAASAGGYAHAAAFVLVDKEGYIRGVYNPTTENGPVDLLEKDLRKLLKYEYGIDGNK